MTTEHNTTPESVASVIETPITAAAEPDHYRELAEQFVREGKSTFADARAALDEYNAVQE